MLKTNQKSNNKLKELRLKAGKTQRHLGEVLKIRGQTISDWECGVSVPRLSLPQTAILCDELNCSIHELAAAFDTEPEAEEIQQKQLIAA